MSRPSPLVPSGPRGANGSSRNNHTTSSRGPSRGGIQKRRGGTPRVDRDGDLVMDAVAGSGRGRGAPSQPGQPYPTTATYGNRSTARGGPVRSVVRGGVSRGGLIRAGLIRGGVARGTTNPRRIGQAWDNINSENAIIRPQQSDAPLRGILKVNPSSPMGNQNSKLNQVSVRGWTESKAASNQDRGIKDLIAFLERKATGTTATARDAVRIVKVCLHSRSAGHQSLRNFATFGPLSFQANPIERRPRPSNFAVPTFG